MRHAFPEAEYSLVETRRKEQLLVLHEFGRRLAAWPTARELFGELERPETASSGEGGKKVSPHTMIWDGGGVWRCSHCWFTPRVPGSRPPVSSWCPKRFVRLEDVIQDPQGHKIVGAMSVTTDTLVLWCITCGAYAHKTPRLLRMECKGQPSDGGTQFLRVISEGRDPKSGEPLHDYTYFTHKHQVRPPECI